MVLCGPQRPIAQPCCFFLFLYFCCIFALFWWALQYILYVHVYKKKNPYWFLLRGNSSLHFLIYLHCTAAHGIFHNAIDGSSFLSLCTNSARDFWLEDFLSRNFVFIYYTYNTHLWVLNEFCCSIFRLSLENVCALYYESEYCAFTYSWSIPDIILASSSIWKG